MSAPFLLARHRWAMAIALAVLALGQAMAAVLFAQAIDGWLQSLSWFGLPMAPIIGVLAVLAGAILLAERWVGEAFAQSFVVDCRAALFAAVTRNAGQGKDARWLTGLVNDMAALRNYALRGSVRLWTSALSAVAAAVWVMLAAPTQRLSILPFALGTAAMLALVPVLARVIKRQRAQRGRLNRFLIRRVRAEMDGRVSAKGHGFKKQAALSQTLRRHSVLRAGVAGSMDAIAALAGSCAAFMLVAQSIVVGSAIGIVGSLTLIAFISARLLETSRALHARVGGQIAMTRLAALISLDSRVIDQPQSSQSQEN